MRERQRALGDARRRRDRGAGHRDGRRAGRRGEGVPRRRRGRASTSAHGRPPGRRRGDARQPICASGTSATRSTRRPADGRGAARHDGPHDRRGRRRAIVASSSEASPRDEQDRSPIWAVGRRDDRDGDQARRALARVRGGARAARRRARRRRQPLQLDRPAGARRREPADAVLHGEGRGASRAGSRPAHALVRRVLRAPRGVRPRRRAHDARDRPERARARAVRRGDASAIRRARARAAGGRDGRDQRGRARDRRCDLRQRRVAARHVSPGLDRLGRAR